MFKFTYEVFIQAMNRIQRVDIVAANQECAQQMINRSKLDGQVIEVRHLHTAMSVLKS